MNDVLIVSNLSKSYPSFKLRDVSFEITEGSITGFIGRNGAGKSTTLKCIMNTVHKDGGEVFFFGKPFAGNEREIKNRTGFITGGVDYYPGKKLKTITDVTKRFYDAWSDEDYRRYISAFGLDENKTPRQLSQGMRVKYSLALALSHNADLLILDEPTSGLDPVSREDLLETFLKLADEGKTVLFSTHVTSDLEKCASNIIYIKDGAIFADDDMRDFEKKFVLIETTEQSVPDGVSEKAIGIRRTKNGFSMLFYADEVPYMSENIKTPTLEDIMVHVEKEGL